MDYLLGQVREWALSPSVVQFFEIPWTVVDQAPLSLRFSRQAEIGVDCHSLLQGIFPPRDRTGVFYIDRQILYHQASWESPLEKIASIKISPVALLEGSLVSNHIHPHRCLAKDYLLSQLKARRHSAGWLPPGKRTHPAWRPPAQGRARRRANPGKGWAAHS